MQMPDQKALSSDPTDTLLRLAHVVSGIEQEAAGPSYTVPALALRQSAAGHQVAIHSLGQPVAQPAAPWHDHRYPKDRAIGSVLGKLGMSRALRDGLRDADYDVLHAHGLWQMPCIYAARAARHAGKHLVVAPRGMLSEAALEYSPQRKWLFARALQDRALRGASLFHATACSEYRDIRHQGFTQPVAIVPNGVDVPLTCDRDRPFQTRRVLSLGRIHPKKGLDVLIEAWARIEAKYPDWRLDLIGPDEAGHAAELQALVKRLKLQNVSLSGPVYGADKWRVYAQADLFVLPTRSENFAVTVAEALASSVPVISSKGAPWSGLTTNGCGWWIDLGIPELAAALDRAMCLDDATRDDMGAKGRAWMIRDFSWERIAQDMAAAYRWLLQGGTLPPHVRVD